jgi:N-acetylglucosaminyl-diphospho-decaprenol L-rhamnosyltransferase
LSSTELPQGKGTCRVSAIVLVFNRPDPLARTLRELERAPIDEVVVVDNASSDDSGEVARRAGARLITLDRNIGMAGRNVGARHANGELLLLVDDDCHPLPGGVDTLVEAFQRNSRLGVAGGMIHETDWRGNRIPDGTVGTFDWWLRCGQKGAPPPGGYPTNSFPECGCMIRRTALLEIGGFLEPFFLHCGEDELSARMLASGWDVRYLPAAEFDHIQKPRDQSRHDSALEFKARNKIWFFLLRYPAVSAIPRMVLHSLAQVVEATALGYPKAWFRGVREAWRRWPEVKEARAPVPRHLIARLDSNRQRLLLLYLIGMAARLVRRRLGWLPAGRGLA